MIALLQRVAEASVDVNTQQIASINKGLLVLLGVEREDNETNARRMSERILGYRVFEDREGKMNLSVCDINGSILLVPQFTLAADTSRGMRPSFSLAAKPSQASALFDHLVDIMQPQINELQAGQFGADMQVSMINDGPVTFWLTA